MPCGFPKRGNCSRLHSNLKAEESSEERTVQNLQIKIPAPLLKVTIDNIKFLYSENGKVKVEVLDKAAWKKKK